jgi:hypothetical protein
MNEPQTANDTTTHYTSNELIHGTLQSGGMPA